MTRKFRIIGLVLFILFTFTVLALTVRGNPGNPGSRDLTAKSWTEDGPFELSPERGRFALTYSMIVDKSLSFSVDLARFVIPDLGYKNGKYVSLFAPGVSYIVAPGFVIGSWLGASQVGAYSVISLFALANTILIILILRVYGISSIASILASMTFLFATPAFSYAVTLYQHHISAFLVLMCIYLLATGESVWAFAAVWFFIAASVPVDYPNLIFMIPVIVWAIARTLTVVRIRSRNHLHISVPRAVAVMGAIIPLIFFLWFNNASYGNPFQFSGTVSSVKDIGPDGKPVAPKQVNVQDRDKFTNPGKQKKTASGFFKTRNLINGLYILLISPDRGVIPFAPVLLLALPGIYFAYRKHRQFTVVVVSVIAFTVTLYSLWGDPWGGWAFGARYLVPAYALAALFIGFTLQSYRTSIFILAIFMNLFAVSTVINTAGALTSSANPPKVEVLNLEKLSGHEEKYTYKRNLDALLSGSSKSFLYQTVFIRYVSPWIYFQYMTGVITLTAAALSFVLHKKNGRLP